MTATLGAMVLALLMGAPAAPASTVPPQAATDVPAELAKLSKAVRDIADLLAKQSEGQKLDLLMKRVELTSTKIAQLEQRQRNLRAEKDGAEDEERQLEAQVKQLQDGIPAQTDEARRGEMSANVERYEAAIKRAAARADAVAGELTDVDSQLATQKRELQQWQNFVDRRLQGL
jgi:phage-related minor tail protein